MASTELETSYPPKSPVIGCWQWLIATIERAGEWLNPILVKECRQALKSRQFAITFSLLLLAGWVWSFTGLAMIGPNVRYSFAGSDMFLGYVIILAFPLLVIVPFTAFRSLAAECEDRTFELVTITTLKPRQIVTGKLGSALAQMVVYLSAVVPCLVFTYLLRGIDIVTIVLSLVYLTCASFGLSVIALMLSTLAREKHWQIVLSVLVTAGLGFVFIFSISFSAAMLRGMLLPVDRGEFWASHLALALAYASYFALFFFAAASQLTFATDNRSSTLRVTMVGQFLLFAGFFVGVLAFEFSRRGGPPDTEVPAVVFIMFSAIHWYVMGAFMVLDDPNLSRRVQRSLPQSFLGRMFLTWFYPGPGTGLMLAVCGTVTALVVSLGYLCWIEGNVSILSGISALGKMDHVRAWRVVVLAASYVVFYLGITTLLVVPLRKVTSTGVALGLAIQLLLVLSGTVLPLSIQGLNDSRWDYSLLQLTNPFWSISEAATQTPSAAVEIATCLLPMLSVIVLLLNLPCVARELQFVRISTPERVESE